MNKTNRFISMITGQDRSFTGHATRIALSCLEPLYRGVIALRNAMFNTGLRKPRRLPRATVSIGNLTTGGTGKTPMVIDLARRLLAHDAHPAVLLRGYRAQGSASSDEAQVLQNELEDAVPVGADANRNIAAGRVLTQHPQVDVFLLDDGFQHRQTHRDLDLVLIDATQPWGFGHVLPRGMLREPVGSLRRADAVIVTRADQVTDLQLAALDGRIAKIAGQPPIAHAAYRWASFTDSKGNDHPIETLRDSRVVGVCGIGNPQTFERALRTHVDDVVALRTYPDHYPYSRDELDQMFKNVRDQQADAIITTHKDMVKWQPLLRDNPTPIPIYYPTLCVELLDGEQAIDALLANLKIKA